ncbi:hypothetical protein WJX77_003810 [Trebouxia sp. C0004]
MADRGQEGNARCSITPKERAAYYLSVRARSTTWQDNMRLFRSRRLFEEYIVDAYGKTEYEKLLYHRYNQDKIRADMYNGLMDAVRANDGIRGNAVGMPIILPSSFIGGARSMREKHQDAMAVVTVKGKPSLFITMTCNPTWPEIQCKLLPGQCAKDRPDLGFPKDFSEETMENIEGAPIYRMPDNGRYVLRYNVKLFNDMVVPYNPALLLKHNCHMWRLSALSEQSSTCTSTYSKEAPGQQSSCVRQPPPTSNNSPQ